MNLTVLLYVVVQFAYFVGCARRADQSKQPHFNLSFFETTPQQDDTLASVQHEIVVFVHGTVVGLVGTHLRDFRFKTPYMYQPVGDIGLHKIGYGLDENIGSALAAHNYRRMHEAIHGVDREFHFYTFGWDGCLNAEQRRKAGKLLYEQLVKERDALQAQTSKRVYISLQGHSHGGSVISYLTEAEDEQKQRLSIDKVGLWGMPVQQETAQSWQHEMFARVYHCYSKKDRVQTLDIVSTKRRRSYRTFDKLCQMPDKVSQVEISVNGMHPTHAELWFLGCINRFLYRKSFPLYPFPCVHLAPALFHAVDTTSHQNRHLHVAIENQRRSYLFRVAPYHADEIAGGYSGRETADFFYEIPHAEPLQAFAGRVSELA